MVAEPSCHKHNFKAVTHRRNRMKVVHNPEDIPNFASEAEEAVFWAEHEISDDFWNRLPPTPETDLPPTRPRTKPIGIRFDESTLRRVKALAARRHKGYQSLLREFVSERLYEEEQREGLIGRVRIST
jgi:predicted DNA binding CopG/RHH family protein